MASNLAKVNALLKAAGRKEVIVRGRGYYYAVDGEAWGWYSSSIAVNSFATLTLAQCISCVESMYKQNGITVKL